MKEASFEPGSFSSFKGVAIGEVVPGYPVGNAPFPLYNHFHSQHCQIVCYDQVPIGVGNPLAPREECAFVSGGPPSSRGARGLLAEQLTVGSFLN